MKKLENTRWVETCEKLVVILLCALMADCCIFGAGRTVMVGPFGFRMTLVAMVMLVAIPVMVRDFRYLIRKKVLWIFAAFAAWLVIQSVRGILRGNSPAVFASDLKGYCYYMMLIPAVCVLNSKKRIHMLMKTMLYASTVLAIISVIATCMYRWNYDLFMKIYEMDPDLNVIIESMIIKRMVTRLFFKSTNYLLVGCAFSIYFHAVDAGKYRWRYPVFTGLCLFGILMSYTRAVYLAAFVTAVTLIAIFLIWGTRDVKVKLWKHLIAATLVFVIIVGGLGAAAGTNYIEHGIRRLIITFGITEEAQVNYVPDVPMNIGEPANTTDSIEVISPSNGVWTTVPEQPAKEEVNNVMTMTIGSDKIRADTLGELKEWIRMAPIFGHGLGKAVNCRDDGLTEYVYHEIVMKTGIAGLILYLLPMLWLVGSMLDKKKLSKSDKLTAGSWLVVLLGFMGFSYFNPYMNASLGILFYCCTVGVFENLKCCHNSKEN